MEVTLTPIGNSQGIRIPKSILDQVGFSGTINLTVKDRSITLSSPKNRQNWPQAFTAKTKPDPDLEAVMSLSTNFDEKEWQW